MIWTQKLLRMKSVVFFGKGFEKDGVGEWSHMKLTLPL